MKIWKEKYYPIGLTSIEVLEYFYKWMDKFHNGRIVSSEELIKHWNYDLQDEIYDSTLLREDLYIQLIDRIHNIPELCIEDVSYVIDRIFLIFIKSFINENNIHIENKEQACSVFITCCIFIQRMIMSSTQTYCFCFPKAYTETYKDALISMEETLLNGYVYDVSVSFICCFPLYCFLKKQRNKLS